MDKGIHDRRGYTNLDAAKFFMSLLIIVIHTRPFARISFAVDFLTADVIARIAVPLFYGISGFLLFGRLEYEDGKVKPCPGNWKLLVRSVMRNAVVYVICSVAYILFSLPSWYASGWWGMPMVRSCIISFFFSGSHYHLWFLLAMIYAVPLLAVVLRFVPVRKLIPVITVCWLVECRIYSYDWISEGLPVMEWLYSRFPIFFDATFRTLPLLGLGALAAKIPAARSSSAYARGALAGVLLNGAEATLLLCLTPNEAHFSYLLTTPLTAYCLLRWLLMRQQMGISGQYAAFLRKLSLWIYCIHPMVIQLLTDAGLDGGLLRWLAVTLLSAAASVGAVALGCTLRPAK